MILVIDTNVLYRDVYAQRAQLQHIFDAAEAGRFEVLTPQVVVEELVRQFPERLRQLIKTTNKNIKSTRRDLEAFGLEVPKEPEIDIDAAMDEYRDRLTTRLTGGGRRIAENPVDAGMAAIWAAQRRTPVKNDGTGVPDAVVWLTALELAHGDDVVLISSNSQDFADPGDATKLHPYLVGDLEAAGLAADRVRLTAAPFEFIKEYLPPAPDVEKQAVEIVESPVLSEIIKTEIGDAVAWLRVEIEGDDWQLGVSVDEAHLAQFEATELELIGAEEGSKGLGMTLRVIGEGRLDLGIWKHDADGIPDDSPVTVYDYDWNESMVAAEAEVPVHLVVELRYTPKKDGAVIVVDVLEVERG